MFRTTCAVVMTFVSGVLISHADDRPSVSLSVGRGAFGVSSIYTEKAGSNAIQFNIDQPVSHHVTVIALAGDYRGLCESYNFFLTRYRQKYLAIGVQATTEEQHLVKAFVWLAAGGLRVEVKDRSYEWQTNTSHVERYTQTGFAALAGVGLFIHLGRSPASLRTDIYVLMPRHDLPKQGFVAIGLRYSL